VTVAESGVAPMRQEPEALLRAEGLRVVFSSRGRPLYAVDGVDIGVGRGETVALVGESGSGKSTTAMALMRALQPQAGRITFDGVDITHADERQLRPIRRRLQMVFQNPYASLDPRHSVRRLITEPLRAHGIRDTAEQSRIVERVLHQVGLPLDAASSLPSQFSGGQRQRISIARALALSPEILVADEPVSALDVSIQAQVVNLLADIQAATGVGYLVIAHDLALVHQISDRVAVMYLGKIVEQGPTAGVIDTPAHPYTAALISATPVARPGQAGNRIVLGGEPPSPIDRPSGCAFHPRCPSARPECADVEPLLRDLGDGRAVACHFPLRGPSVASDHSPASEDITA